MNQTDIAHPSAEQLVAFGQGRLPPATQAQVERHVAGCDACCAALRRVPDDTLVGQLRQMSTLPEGPAPRVVLEHGVAVPAELADHPRYRVVKVLGSGGMGVVYQAEHRLMERTVALKILGRNFINNPTAVERFRQEFKAAARLAHPNIVAALDAEQVGGLHFLVMEFIDGVSLARHVEKRGPLPVTHACHYIRQAALGLQHASEQGMVHRDVKPQNLMLTPRGQVKILDFGLARLRRQGKPREITKLGAVLGTPDYIAPEQADDSSTVDVRADVYGLGCTLYFLLTGRPPFPEGTAAEKLLAHASATPEPVTRLRPDVPAELAAVVEKMMAKDAARRYQMPVEVADALAPFTRAAAQEVLPLAELAAPAPHRAPRRRWAVFAVTAAASVLAAGGLLLAAASAWWGFAHFRKGNPERPDDRPPPVSPAREAEEVYYDCTVVAAGDGRLSVRDTGRIEHSAAVAPGASITLDGTVCKLEDLPQGAKVKLGVRRERGTQVIVWVEGSRR
jgi:predicted Ser/Thr protein kinase